jgi:hypothetical protein
MLFLRFQPLDNFITNETFSISNYSVQRLLLFCKEKKKMDMIRHDSVAKELMTVGIENLEEFVNLIIGICELDEMEPFEACESDKVNA